MIEGVKIRCTVGGVEIMRSPEIYVSYKRRAVLSRASIAIPDPFGDIRGMLALGSPVHIRFGYRGEMSLWHEWQGTVESIDQAPANSEGEDSLVVRCVGLEKAVLTTFITEAFYQEPASSVARRLLARTGLSIGTIQIPDEILPHQIFSDIPVSRAIKQLEMTLTRSFGHDLQGHALWLGQRGLTWSAGDELGQVYRIATAENLLTHTPPPDDNALGVIRSVLLPNLRHSMRVHIRDARRGVDSFVRALEVLHTLRADGNTTTVTYGKEQGWG